MEQDGRALEWPISFPRPGEGYGLERPAFWAGELQAWIFSAYADVDQVLRDSKTFSSQHVLGPERGARLQQLVAHIDEDPRASSVAPYIHLAGHSDGEAHRRTRSFYNRAFMPARIGVYEPAIRDMCERLASAIAGRRAVPFVAEFAVPLTVQMIARTLGLPEQDFRSFKRWSDGFEGLTTARPTSTEVEAFLTAAVEFTDYISPLIEQRRREPAADIISAVAAENEAGDRLTTSEVLAMLASLMLAGNETTTAALSGTVLYLARQPGLQEAVRADRSLIPALVEEGLRLTAPAQALFRTATTDTEVGGVKVAKGEHVYVRFAAANRDSARFDQPLCPRVDRADNRHLTFGKGPHACPGAPLARIELRIALETLFERTGLIVISDTDDPVRAAGNPMTYRVGELYLDIHAAA